MKHDLYLTNPLNNPGNYEIGEKKHGWDKKEGFVSTVAYWIREEDFVRCTGIRCEPGKIIKIKIEVDETKQGDWL